MYLRVASYSVSRYLIHWALYSSGLTIYEYMYQDNYQFFFTWSLILRILPSYSCIHSPLQILYNMANTNYTVKTLFDLGNSDQQWNILNYDACQYVFKTIKFCTELYFLFAREIVFSGQNTKFYSVLRIRISDPTRSFKIFLN